MIWSYRIVLVPAVAGVLFCGCGDSGSDGTGSNSGSDTGTTGSMGTTSGPMNTTGVGTGTAGSATGVDSTATSGPADTTEGTTGPGDECDACIARSCAKELSTCMAVAECDCWLVCIGEGNNNGACMAKCGPRPDEYDAVRTCADQECDVECNGPATTGTGSTSGTGTTSDTGTGSSSTGGGDSNYAPCEDDADCPGGLMCNGFFGYCSVECGMGVMCPTPDTGNIDPVCSGFSDTCVLPCGGGGDMCPDNMSCEDIGGGGEICVFL